MPAGNDRLMRGGEVDRMLQVAKAQSDAEMRHHQEMVASLQRAMSQPQIVETIKIAGVAIGEENGQRVLVIATADGRRRDVVLNAQIEKVLLQGLAAPVEVEKAA